MSSPLIRLLLVDDDAMQLELVERALSRDGFEVRGASTLAALAHLAAELGPELVMVDVNMPEAPLEAVVAAVRVAAPAARVILYSAWEESKLKKLAQELGAHGYVSKSESVFELGPKLRRFTG
jgi:two-component system, OmpR family, response regulator